MNNTQLLYRKSHLSKWLLALSLICSLFIFSGYVGHSPIQQQKVQTESVLGGQISAGRSVASYQQKSVNPVANTFTASLYHTCSCAVYNRLIKVKLTRLSVPSVSFNTFQFHHSQTAPHYADEDARALLLA